MPRVLIHTFTNLLHFDSPRSEALACVRSRTAHVCVDVVRFLHPTASTSMSRGMDTGADEQDA
eukprot:1256287-Lingulodinium_polyedra.AAC.1